MALRSPPAALSSFIIAPTLSPLNITVKDYLVSYPSNHHIVAGALVFSQCTPPQLLIVQRAPQDFMPNLWEIPGGSCDANETILAGTTRELWEESGLVATEVLGQIGEGYQLGDKENGWYKLTFEVEVEGMEVALDEEEHQAFFWATEEECRGELL